MTIKGDENELLRSVALQNATSILVARQRAERRSEAYLAEAQRLSHTGSFGWRLSTDEIIWSEETFRIFEYDRTTIPTMELVLQRAHPEDAVLVKQTIERASQAGRDFDHEYRLVMPDSSIKYVHIVAHALSDESGGIEFAGAMMDVTMAKQAEGRIRQIIETIPDYAWSTEPDGSIDFFNQRVLEFIGLPKEDLLGWGWGSAVHPDDLARLVDEWRAALAIGEPLKSEARVLRANGEYCWWLIRSAPLRDELGNIVKWYGTGIDIEDRKRGEEAQRQAQADLAHVSRVTTMGELTASLAHEVKQPIAAALTNARTCLRWLAGDTPNIEEARAAAMRIVNDAQRATEIIGRTSLLFKKGTAQRELVDINEVIREMIVLLRNEAMRYSISVRTELAAELPQVEGDRVQLQQVLMNLMINGIDAMKDADGTRELAIKSQRAENEQLLISVSDTGVGLPPQQADQIFNAFFTTKPQGTGMGLRISRSIIESHGGRLWAADNSPRGASFYFTLLNKLEAHE